jgi:uncharacterized protein
VSRFFNTAAPRGDTNTFIMKTFDLTCGVFLRGLTALRAMLHKAEEHARASGLEPRSLLGARLAGDMYDLATQVHWAASTQLAIDRLLGGTSPPPPAAEVTSFAQLHERIDAALAHLASIDPAALEGGLARSIELPARGGPRAYRGEQFVTEFALPNFYFHLAMAYAILRHEGVPLQKGDFMGG